MVAYLEIQVSQIPFLLPMENIQEVLYIAASLVVPVTAMPSSVLGLLSHHSRIYWTLDLGKVLGLSPLVHLPKYAVTILNMGEEIMAIASEEINSIHQISEPIQALPADTLPHLIPYLDGYIHSWMVLNPQSILKSLISNYDSVTNLAN